MKLPLIDYRQFRLSRLNTPQFRHLKLLLFWPIFSLVFCYLENYRPTVYYAPMRCALDHWIPFCKWFVIPYAFWFLFVGGMLLYTLFYNIPAFRRMMWFIILTYSFALVTYLLFPNCQHLRPTLLGGDLLTRFTAKLYAADTNTNVLPSMHVIGCAALTLACFDAPRLRAKKLHLVMLTLGVLISASTVFVKQHSMLDVLVAIPVSVVLCLIVYRPFPRNRLKQNA